MADPPLPQATAPPGATATADIELSIGEERFDVRVTVPAGPTRPSRLLPVFRAFADAVVGVGVQSEEREGRTVTCVRGCAACCRQLIPVTATEAVALQALVAGLPPSRRDAIDRGFVRARERVAEAGMLDRLRSMARLEPAETELLALDYLRAWIDCPFLDGEECMIYEERPFACREYLVTTDPAHCSNPTKETVACVPLPARVSNALARLEKATVPSRGGRIPLLFAEEWVAEHPEEEPGRTGPQIIEELVRHLSGPEER